MLDVKHATSAYPEQVKPEKPDYQGRGQPPKARYRDDLCSLSDLALGVGSDAAEAITWREGTPGEVTSRFLTLRVRAANIELRRAAAKHDRERELCSLICEWPEHKDQPVKYWLSNLPADTPISVGKLRWRIEHDYRELKDALGLIWRVCSRCDAVAAAPSRRPRRRLVAGRSGAR